MSEDRKLAIPAEKNIQKLLELEVKGEDGKAVKFNTLIKDGSNTRVVTVFIRHFFCGFCEEYIRALTKDLPPATLASLSPPTKLVIIGCGESGLITEYKKRTACPYDIYADSTRKTYNQLDFITTLATGQTPTYVTRSFGSTVWSSFLTNLTAGAKMFSGGKQSQNGGEVVWVDGELKYINRMTNTTDHMEVADLRKVLDGGA